ncbi:hypothetical protein N9K75_02135 [bacterium]|nr:hypothetical protein [bacterium]
MTKKELEEKCKALRAELDKAHVELKELQGEKKELGVLDETGVGGYYDKEKKSWFVAEIGFNKETGEAKITNTKKMGNDFAIFAYEINKFIVEKINMRGMR